jgi:hypothetical protein
MSDAAPAFPCPFCGKTRFRDERARYDHARAAHPGEPLRDILPAKERADREAHRIAMKNRVDDEPSLAEIAIDASIRRAMGQRIEDWEASLLP